MGSPPRNDPCPCGSGKKAKKCCFGIGDSPPVMPLDAHRRKNLDLRDSVSHLLFEAMQRWGRKEPAFAQATTEALEALPFEPTDEAAVQFGMAWLLHCARLEGRTPAERYVAEKTPRRAEETAWLAAEGEAWLGLWEVERAEPGDSLELLDRLTGQRRRVLDRLGSSTIPVRSGLLARVVEHDGSAWFSGLYPSHLPPAVFEAVVEEVLEELEAEPPLDPARLRDTDDTLALIWAWTDGLGRHARRPPPVLTNTDGHPLLGTTDRFAFDPKDRAAVREAVLGLECCEPEELSPEVETPGEAETDRFVLHRKEAGAAPATGRTVVGFIELRDDVLALETNSVERADEHRARLEQAAGALLRHRSREHEDPAGALEQGGPSSQRQSDDFPPEVVAQVVREYKEQHYARWTDEPVPALSGLTPREAASRPESRQALERLLRQIEHDESRMPADERFDVGQLRRELGMD